MDISDKRPIENCEDVFARYGDMLFRLCFIMVGNEADAKDALQDTVVSYLKRKRGFEDAGHERAWLITTAKNRCRDILRFRSRHQQVDIDDLREVLPDKADSDMLEILMSIPEKYRLVIILHYIEGYKVDEIASLIKRSPSAVKMRLQTGRRMLKELYEKEGF